MAAKICIYCRHRPVLGKPSKYYTDFCATCRKQARARDKQRVADAIATRTCRRCKTPMLDSKYKCLCQTCGEKNIDACRANAARKLEAEIFLDSAIAYSA